MRVIGITGRKNGGKTGLVERLAAALVRAGHDVGTAKHVHHDAEVDMPGTDTWRHRRAGARQVALVGARRTALFEELRGAPEPSLIAVLSRMDVGIVLVEGWKDGPQPKIEAWRASCGAAPLLGAVPRLRAVAADSALPAAPPAGVPVVHLDDTERLVELVLAHAEAPPW